jgi:hypothetical protein
MGLFLFRRKNNFSDLGYNRKMGILDNFENAWDIDLETESSPIRETDNMGRERFWEDVGRPEEANLSVKLFSETCCSGCTCKND